MTVTDSPISIDTPPAGGGEPGLVCRACGHARWKVLETRKATGCVRRWRRCLECRGVTRTAERVEAGPHADFDAA